jgi:hypothetical protein
MKRSTLLLVLALASGALLTLTPAALGNGRVIHKVSVGSADVVPPPGTDANFSLSATQDADGTVRGQWGDTVFGRSFHAIALHVDIDCLVVVGSDAWVSGIIARPAVLAGLRANARVRDTGTSANDPPDQISLTFFPPAIDPGVTCEDQPDLPLLDLVNGQVNVQ